MMMRLLCFNAHPCVLFVVLLLGGCLHDTSAILYGSTAVKDDDGSDFILINFPFDDTVTNLGRVRTAAGDPLYLNALAYDRTTDTLYGHTSPNNDQTIPGWLVTIDVGATAVGTPVGEVMLSAGFVVDLSFDSTGQLFALGREEDPDGGSLHRMDKTTAATTRVGDSGLVFVLESSGMAFDSDDVLHLLDFRGVDYFIFDTTTGEAIAQPAMEPELEISHGDVEPGTKLYYAASVREPNGMIDILDLDTQSSTGIVVTGVQKLFLLAFGPEPGSPAPTASPTMAPTAVPTGTPTMAPTTSPSNVPTGLASAAPSLVASTSPTLAPACSEEARCDNDDGGEAKFTVHRRFLFGLFCRAQCVELEEARTMTQRRNRQHTCGPC